jgi:2-polyprenyl-6-methoxyphenol hydroxylase-like FAD-dependent oxidoreductase
MIDATVLVVGCGPTGIAHELLRRGISCRLVGKRPAPQSSTRAFTVHTRTMEMFGHGHGERRTAAMARVRWFWCVPTCTWITSVPWTTSKDYRDICKSIG